MAGWSLLFDFKENTTNHCIYLKASGSQFIIIALYVDDILLANSRVKLLTETKFMLIATLIRWTYAFVVLGIHIFVIGHVAFLDCFREDTLINYSKFNMHSYSLCQCPQIDNDRVDLEKVP